MLLWDHHAHQLFSGQVHGGFALGLPRQKQGDLMFIIRKYTGAGDEGSVGAVFLGPADAGLHLPHDAVAVHLEGGSVAAHPGDQQLSPAPITELVFGLLTGQTVQRAVLGHADPFRQQFPQIGGDVRPGRLPNGYNRNCEHYYHQYKIFSCLLSI